MTATIAAWGGGVNSTAMLVEWLRRGESLDLVLFADTGGEKPETYAYRDLFAAWLKTQTEAPFVTVRANSKHASLEAECLTSRTLPSIAYGFKRCSLKWKRGPQDVFVNNWPLARAAWERGEKVAKLIGFDAGEERRASRDEDEKYRYRYPLIEWGMDRDGCLAAIDAAGLPRPPKSACFFCPSSRVSEILALRGSHPDLAERALAMEANAELDTVKGLGRRFAWRDVLEQDRRQGRLFAESHVAVPCDCFDGDDDGTEVRA